MKKKNARILVFVLACLLAVWGMVIYPMLHRGTLSVSVGNDTDRTFTLVRINDQEVNLVVEPGNTATVKYTITEDAALTAYFVDQHGATVERLLTEGITPLATTESYGRVMVTIKEKSGILELSLLSNISD